MLPSTELLFLRSRQLIIIVREPAQHLFLFTFSVFYSCLLKYIFSLFWLFACRHTENMKLCCDKEHQTQSIYIIQLKKISSFFTFRTRKKTQQFWDKIFTKLLRFWQESTILFVFSLTQSLQLFIRNEISVCQKWSSTQYCIAVTQINLAKQKINFFARSWSVVVNCVLFFRHVRAGNSIN